VEFNSFGPAVGRLGSDSSRGAKVEAGGAEPLLAPLTLTTDRKVLWDPISFRAEIHHGSVGKCCASFVV